MRNWMGRYQIYTSGQEVIHDVNASPLSMSYLKSILMLVIPETSNSENKLHQSETEHHYLMALAFSTMWFMLWQWRIHRCSHHNL